VITAPARALMDELGITADQVRALGVPLVRRTDVERLAAASEPDRRHVVSPAQRAVGRTVSRSHRTIPAAYTVVRVDAGPAQARAARLGARLRAAIGLPELLVAAVAPLYADFPLCFAEPLDEESVRLPDDAHVGITVDAGHGLFVPVVRNASGLDVERIARATRAFRRSAERNDFRAADLDGGNITISLNHEPGVVAAIPVIFPGQTCAVTLTSTRTEPVVDEEGAVVPGTVTDIGLAYDHRFVNGRDAVLFLQRVRQALESEGGA
jgi:2-oxoglutarate dehydrogenase E2 component (dihydrolipoamide succinyltransferase)